MHAAEVGEDGRTAARTVPAGGGGRERVRDHGRCTGHGRGQAAVDFGKYHRRYLVTRERALVLGGGGLAGIAWETGVLAGLAAGGVDVTTADLIVGTSAGATVAAQLGSGLPLAELFERQADPSLQNKELVPTGLTSAG